MYDKWSYLRARTKYRDFIRHDVPHQLELPSNVFGILVSLEPDVAVELPTQNLFLPILNLIDQKQIANRFG